MVSLLFGDMYVQYFKAGTSPVLGQYQLLVLCSKKYKQLLKSIFIHLELFSMNFMIVVRVQ